MAGIRESKPKRINTLKDFLNWLDSTGERDTNAPSIDDRYREAAKRRNRRDGQRRRRLREGAERIKKLKMQLSALKQLEKKLQGQTKK